jgi:CBS domain-containing protein
MNNPGSNYSTQPTVTITGDGTGATAIAKITNRRIESILVTNRGTGYTRALVTITGGGGFGASAIVELDARLGKLRTFYNDADANKQVVNEDAGTIDYDTGMITLPDLNVLSVNATDGTIRLTIGSENTILSSIKNTIITIDQDDAASIVTDLIEE